jgi:hypothetical protein
MEKLLRKRKSESYLRLIRLEVNEYLLKKERDRTEQRKREIDTISSEALLVKKET